MFFLGGIIINFVQTIASAAVEAINPNLMNSTAGSLLVTMIPMYVIAIPLMGFLNRRIPAQKIAPKKMSAGKWLIAFLNLLRRYVCQQYDRSLPDTDDRYTQRFPGYQCDVRDCYGLQHPRKLLSHGDLCADRGGLLFRRLLVDRMVKYGEATAVLFSGLMFALFHGNLNQFVYAFTLGVFFCISV